MCDFVNPQEKRVVAPIRCGGVPQSYSKQLLLVGDAAGHVDPLTGASNILYSALFPVVCNFFTLFMCFYNDAKFFFPVFILITFRTPFRSD